MRLRSATLLLILTTTAWASWVRQRPLPLGGFLADIAFHRGRYYVSQLGTGKLFVSPDLDAWRETPILDFDGRTHVAFDGRLVASGGRIFLLGSPERIAREDDEGIWRLVHAAAPTPVQYSINDVVFDGSGWVAVGGRVDPFESHSLVLKSADGIAWQQVGRGTWPFPLYAIRHAGGQYLFAFRDGAISRSRDGREWERWLEAGDFRAGDQIFDYAVLGDELWAVGDRGRIVHGNPQRGWTEFMELRSGPSSADGGRRLVGIVADADGILIRGAERSGGAEHPIALFLRPNQPPVKTRLLPSGFGEVRDLVRGNGRYVAIGKGDRGPFSVYSDDGVTWSAPTPMASEAFQLAYGDGVFRATAAGRNGYTAVLRSHDGVNWTPEQEIDLRPTREISFQGGAWMIRDHDNGVFTWEPPERARWANASVLTAMAAGDRPAMGFVIAGTETKRVLLRVAGPALAKFGVSPSLADPRLVLRDANGRAVDAETAGLGPAARRAHIAARSERVGAFPLGEAEGEADVFSLPAGAYVVEASSRTGGAGTLLMECYDAAPGAGALINVSYRGRLGPQRTPTIVGMVSAGRQPCAALIRGVTDGLQRFGLAPVAAGANFFWQAGATATAFDGRALDATASASIVELQRMKAGAWAIPPGGDDVAVAATVLPGVQTFTLRPGERVGEVLFEVYLIE